MNDTSRSETIEVTILSHGPRLYDSNDRPVGYSLASVRDTTGQDGGLPVFNEKIRVGTALQLTKGLHEGREVLRYRARLKAKARHGLCHGDVVVAGSIEAAGWTSGLYPTRILLSRESKTEVDPEAASPGVRPDASCLRTNDTGRSTVANKIGKDMSLDAVRGYMNDTLAHILDGEIDRYVHAAKNLLGIPAVYNMGLESPRDNLLRFLANYATAAGWPEDVDHVGDLGHLSDDDIDDLCNDIVLLPPFHEATALIRAWGGRLGF